MEVNVKMEFLEDLDLYNKAMENAYFIVTRKKTLKQLLTELEAKDIEEVVLPFDPIREDGRTADIIEMLVEYFETIEEYEKCAELTNLIEHVTKRRQN
jgi:recombinational DNA repair protein RecR